MMRKLVPHREHCCSSAEDSGAALVGVIGLMLVCMILLVSVATATLVTTNSTSTTRATVQARANAEAALDWFVARLAAGDSPSALVGGGPDNSVILNYDGDLATGLRVTAEGKGRAPGASNPANPVTVNMTAVVTLVSASGGTLETAIFGNNGVSAQNNLVLAASSDGKPADVYVDNGSLTCNTAGNISGSLIAAQGNISLSNSCQATGKVQSGGDISINAGTTVNGDMIAAGKITQGGGSPTINGNLYANGDIYFYDGKIAGSVYSAAGSVHIRNGGEKVGGSVYALKNIKIEGSEIGLDLLSETGSIELNGGVTIGGSAASPLGILFTADNGWVKGNTTAWAGSIATSSMNANKRVGSSVSNLSQAINCISDRIVVTGTANLSQATCTTLPLTYDPSVPTAIPAQTIPSVPTNPPGIDATVMEPTVSGPETKNMPGVPIRDAGGSVDLSAWVAAGWTVVELTSADLASGDSGYIRRMQTIGTPENTAWQSGKLALYISSSVIGGQFSMNEGYAISNTFTLFNDLAIIADRGVSSHNFGTFVSSDGTSREFMWIVPSDSPVVSPSCISGDGGGQGDLKPMITSSANIKWAFYTPCDFYVQNDLGSSGAPIVGVIYAGRVSTQQVYLQYYSENSIPGLVQSSCGLTDPGWPCATVGGGGGAGSPVTGVPIITAKYDS